MKLHLETIDVNIQNDVPQEICWRGGMHQVLQVLDRWWSSGPWWDGGEQRWYLLVETTHGVMEIFRSTTQGWVLARTFD